MYFAFINEFLSLSHALTHFSVSSETTFRLQIPPLPPSLIKPNFNSWNEKVALKEGKFFYSEVFLQQFKYRWEARVNALEVAEPGWREGKEGRNEIKENLW